MSNDNLAHLQCVELAFWVTSTYGEECLAVLVTDLPVVGEDFYGEIFTVVVWLHLVLDFVEIDRSSTLTDFGGRKWCTVKG